jgi:hypothetical protein
VKARRKWKCLDCSVDTGKAREHYFLHGEVWAAAGMGPFGMLCIGCVEIRLNRELTSQDFTSAWINNPKAGEKSSRLLSRLLD